MADVPKVEIRLYKSDGTEHVIRGELWGIDIVSPLGNTKTFKAEGVFRDWDWYQGAPTWAEDIPKEADPLRLPWDVREGAGRPSDQGGVGSAEGAVGRSSQDVEDGVLPEGEPDGLP